MLKLMLCAAPAHRSAVAAGPTDRLFPFLLQGTRERIISALYESLQANPRCAALSRHGWVLQPLRRQLWLPLLPAVVCSSCAPPPTPLNSPVARRLRLK